MMIKHSARTVRKPCKDCGSTDLYWYHDTQGRRGARFCAEHGSSNWTLTDKDGTRHECTIRAAERVHDGDDEVIADDIADDEQLAETPVETPVTPISAPADTVAPITPGSGTREQLEALQALQTLFGQRPIDRDEVEVICRSVIDNLIFPTRTVIIRDDVSRPVEGDTHKQLADVTTAVLSGEHVMMVGPAGTGKSTIAEQAAEALGLDFYAISLSAQTPASQFLGYMNATGDYVSTLFRQAYEHGGLFHFDEVDSGHPSIMTVINAALANGHMAFPDAMVKRHADFRCVASANTYGRGATRQYVGRQAIDAAFLDRFTIITIDVDDALETALARATGIDATGLDRVISFVRKVRQNADKNGLLVVISPRATVGMCRLIAAGMSWDSAVDMRVRRGVDDATWSKLNV